ncbi:unnamed protein product [Symbiodinium natans]|uniref:EF-hand domain-containing protein n=1 Tax=Symbiodinium natans TaxID=878477 RepID=A0A812RKS9_9DINO|nr:unnamed protein product [Symbiodinium natans]
MAADATSGWLLKRCAALGDRWVRHWCVFKYSQEEDVLALDCYADESCRRRLYHICMGKGARVMQMQSKEIPAAFLKFRKQHPHSLIVHAGDGRLCPFYLFDAVNEDSVRVWRSNVTSQMQALELKRRRHQEEQLSSDRSKIIDCIFALLDRRRSGSIWSDDLRRYAETSGFLGTDDEWQHEFEELCEDRGWKEEKQISANQFGKFLSSDTSVSIEELSKILECLEGLYDPPATDSWAKQSVVTNNLKLKTRSDIITALFNCLKSSETGRIGCEELQRYAALSGFDGDDDDWLEEYGDLCEDQGWDKDIGLAHEDFMGMLEDDSMGSDEELKAMLMELRMPRKRGARTLDQMSHLAKKSAAGRVRTEVSQMSREDLVNEAFVSLDVKRTAVLGSREFRRYAELTGYDGGDEGWPLLYSELCQEYGWQSGAGVTREQFAVFIGDESHSPDDELQRLAQSPELVLELRLRQDVALRRFRRHAVFLKPSAAVLVFLLSRGSFRCPGSQADSEAGFEGYAHLTGFYGTDADWDAEFRGMCENLHWSELEGASRSQFRDFIGDEENTSNEELQVLLFNLPKDQARRSLVASRYKGLARRELLEELFAALSEGPELPPSQLRRLAELTGASSLRGESGMTRAQFVRVLEDDGQTSTDMLRQALLTVRGEALISGKPWSRRSFVQTWRRSDVANMDRPSMIEAIFATLDQSKSGVLDSDRIRAYAEQTGFEGTDGDWAEQFAAMCQHFGWVQDEGITQSQFRELVEDDDETDDDELRQALLNLQMQPGTSGRASVVGSSWQRKRSFVQTWRMSDVANMDRPSMIEAIFTTLDKRRSGVLDSEHIRAYAEQTGFEGTAGDWAEQFAAMCQHFGWAQGEGITQSQFRELVEDDDETDDDELRQALLNLQMQPETSSRASVVGSSWQRKSLLHLPSQDFAANMSRPDIISAIFSLLDTAGHAKLFSAQLKQFAISSGFEGDADEWSSQFDAMCAHFGWNVSEGISKAQFVEFVGDEVEHSDDELRRVLVSLAQR